MSKRFKLTDSFKGNFTKDEEKPLNEVLICEDEATEFQIDDSMLYFPIEEWSVGTPSKSAVVKINLDEYECQHEPIDVGFNSIKLVCKKCNKDL